MAFKPAIPDFSSAHPRGLLAIAAVLIATSACLLLESKRAGAEEPDLMQTLVADDVTLNNNLMPFAFQWAKSGEGSALAYGFGVEKQLSERLGIEIEAEWDAVSPQAGQDSQGFGNVDITLKYVFLKLPESGFAFALAGDLSLPTSSHIGDQRMYAETGAALVWGGRLEQLPDRGWTRYLRPLEIQGDAGYSREFDATGAAILKFDPVIDYSLPFLNYESGGALPWWIRYFCPFIEFNLDRPVGDGSDGPARVFFMPGLALMADTYQLAAGAQIAVDHAAAADRQVAVAASLLIFMDAIDRRFAWMPF